MGKPTKVKGKKCSNENMKQLPEEKGDLARTEPIWCCIHRIHGLLYQPSNQKLKLVIVSNVKKLQKISDDQEKKRVPCESKY